MGIALALLLTGAAESRAVDVPEITESTGRMGSVLRWNQLDNRDVSPLATEASTPVTLVAYTNRIAAGESNAGAVPASAIPTPGAVVPDTTTRLTWGNELPPGVAPLPSPTLPSTLSPPPGTMGSEVGVRQLDANDCPDAARESPVSTAILDRIPINEQVPNLCPMTDDGFNGRCWSRTDYHWTASALCSKPIYFIDNNLERYGQTNGPMIQPIVSAGHFFLSVPMLPYAMGLYPPNECIYALGDYRAGSYAPKYIEPLPISFRAVAAEGIAIGAAVAILP